jgi:antitoxin CcdA
MIFVVTQRRGRSTPTNVSLDSALVAEARELGINISQASARGLEQAVAAARAARWAEENRAAIESSNAFVETRGLPLQSLRRF